MNRNKIENKTTDTRIIRYNEQKRNLNETTKSKTDDTNNNKTKNETIKSRTIRYNEQKRNRE